MIKAGEVVRWDPQWVIPIYGRNGSYVCKYIIDFAVYLPNGTIKLVEIKGMATQFWRLKLKLAVDAYKGDDRYLIEVVFGKKERGEMVTTKIERYFNGNKI